MFNCSACMERCLHGLIGNASISAPSIRTSVVTATALGRDLSRNYGTSSSAASSSRPPRQYESSSHYGQQQPQPRYNAGPNSEREPRDTKPGGFQLRRHDYKLEQKMQGVLSKHPVYGSDPVKLAEYIRKALKGDDFESALAVVRAASKGLSCTVSWNHLIDWQMSKGKMNSALKTYNEMKKRGQPPDSHTFSIIIRGCTEHRDLKAGLGKVMAIYHAMLLDNSPIKPNTIHLNAILKMCARANDMDSMFGVVASMPYKGMTAPNNLTFTTILNALRMNTLADSRLTLTPMQQRQNTQAAIEKGRHIWMDITKRWRHGDIWIDEELACSMGRLMLSGAEQDSDDILSLIEQTFNIPRQIPRLGTKERTTVHPASQGRITEVMSGEVVEDSTSSAAPASQGSPGDSPEGSPETEAQSPPVDNFKPISLPTPPKSVGSAYARPGRNSLSLVLAAAEKLNLKEVAYKYWKIMVKEIGVKPDPDNFHVYLRILRKARASTETIEFLQTMNLTEMRRSTFRIAISACERDKRNRNAFANAGKLLDLMTDSLRVPDIPVLTTYLEIAVSSSDKISPRDHGKRILRALDRLGPSLLNIKSLLIYGDADVPMTKDQLAEFQGTVFLLVRRMIAAHDICMDKALVDRSKFKDLIAQRSKLAAYVSRYKNHNVIKNVSPTIEPPTEIRTLPAHLARYVDTHGLSRSMVMAQETDETWEKFVGEVENEYNFSNALNDHTNSGSRTSASESATERSAEEERIAAEELSERFRAAQ